MPRQVLYQKMDMPDFSRMCHVSLSIKMGLLALMSRYIDNILTV